MDAADDGLQMRYIWSGNAQSAPANFSGNAACVSGLGTRNGTVLDFLAELFV